MPAGPSRRARRAAFRADILLLVAAGVWGIAFVPQRTAMQHMGPLTYNGLRFTLGAVALLPIVAARAARRGRREPGGKLSRAVKAPTPADARLRPYLVGGSVAGAVLLVSATLQQAGLVHTTAGKAGFITGLYVPLVPVLGLLVGARTRGGTWLGIALAATGLYLLSVPSSRSGESPLLRVNRGDLLVLAGAVGWAMHVLVIGRLSPRLDPLKLGLAQFVVTGAISLVGAAFVEPLAKADLAGGLGAILYGGLASVAVAYTLQIVGQRTAPPAHAALVLSLEAVFAAAAGWLLLGEILSPRELAGAALMFAGTLVSQLLRGRLAVGAGNERS